MGIDAVLGSGREDGSGATAALSSLRLQWAQQEGTGCVAATMAPMRGHGSGTVDAAIDAACHGFSVLDWDLGWLKVWAVGNVVFGELKELAEV
ncbi:hypothetical protein M0R45_029810 [Rubus argutus]|uniref:Uncharacterized protein n=1 Tax=Rubus argutus TaxID=59490 RepID=A0AAW1W9I0_RUBAR